MLAQVQHKALLVAGALPGSAGEGGRGDAIRIIRQNIIIKLIYIVLGIRGLGVGVQLAFVVEFREGTQCAVADIAACWRKAEPAGAGEATEAAQFYILLPKFAFQGFVDGQEGGVGDFEVEDFALAPGLYCGIGWDCGCGERR